MEFYDNNRCVINSLRIKNWIICELEASIILYYTGVSRESSRIIQEQSKSLHIANSVALNAMHSIKSEAVVMKEAILRGDFESLVDSVKNGWHKKKATAKNISNSSIDMVYESALSAGALGGKVSGAGGGGFMWFFVKPDKRMDVIRALKHYGGEVSNCHFTKTGAQAWRIL
jgi:D-glycero-alpha-D-manno-heptose-7-phosphate kinase